MGILDDALFHLFEGPEIGGRKGRKVLERGERAGATITGILVTRTQIGEHASEANDFAFAYALDVRGPEGEFRVGVRQRLDWQRWRAHVGAEVIVAVDGDGVVIDWERTLVAWGLPAEATNTHSWKVFDEPPEAGVTDRHAKPIPPGEAVEATLVAERHARVLGMDSALSCVFDLELRFPDGRVEHRRTGRVGVPDYARWRIQPGAVLRAGVDGRGRVRIDWLALANEPLRSAPVPEWRGDPAPEVRDVDPMEVTSKIAGALGVTLPDFAEAASAPAPAREAHGASFDRWMELKAQMEVAGVGRKERDAWIAAREPAVTSWKDLDRHWSKAMSADPALATRWGALWPQAVSAAMSGSGATRIGPG